MNLYRRTSRKSDNPFVRPKPGSLRARIFLIPVILAVPILILSAMLIRGEVEKNEVLNVEIKGARALAPVAHLYVQVLQHQTFVLRASARRPFSVVQRRQETVGEAVSAAEAAVILAGNDRAKAQMLRLREICREIDAVGTAASKQEMRGIHRAAMAAAGELLTIIGEEFGLMEDADKVTYNAIIMLIVQWQDLAFGAGEVRRIGMNAILRGALSSEENRHFESILAGLERAAERSDRSFRVAAGASAPDPFPAGGRLEPFVPAIRALNAGARGLLSSPSHSDAFEGETGRTEALIGRYSGVLTAEIVERLDRRSFAARIKGLSIMIAALAVLIVMFFFVGLLVKSTSGKIQRLIDTSNAFGNGDLQHRYQAQGIIELDRLGHSFNEMADRLQKTFAYVSRSDSLIKNIFDSAPALILIKDTSLRWTMLNKAAAELLETLYGRSAAYFLGKTDAELNAELDLTRFYGKIDSEKEPLADAEGRALGGELVRLESTVTTGRAPARWLRLEASPQREESGRIYGLMLTMRDITDQKQSAARQKELEDQLQQKQKMETVGTLASGIAHDFNNILGVILLNADMLEDHIREPAGAASLERVQTATKRARELVRKMLTFAKRIEYVPSPITLVDEVKEAVPLIASAASPNVKIVQILPAAGVWIRADRTHILQVSLNLGLNAVHAMGEAGGELTIEVDHLRLDHPEGRLAAGTYGRLTVTDTGPGIPDQLIGRIFEPFYTTKGPGEGSGLGLSTALGIVESHGGSISVAKARSGGAVFIVLLPAEIGTPAQAPALVKTKGIRLDEARILFVDDDAAYRGAMAATLAAFGCKVEVFAAPGAALAWIEQGGECDAALVDFTMPGMTGLELVEKIRRIRPDLPALISSGRFDPPSEADGRMMFRFLAKPCTTGEVRTALLELIGGSTDRT